MIDEHSLFSALWHLIAVQICQHLAASRVNIIKLLLGVEALYFDKCPPRKISIKHNWKITVLSEEKYIHMRENCKKRIRVSRSNCIPVDSIAKLTHAIRKFDEPIRKKKVFNQTSKNLVITCISERCNNEIQSTFKL